MRAFNQNFYLLEGNSDNAQNEAEGISIPALKDDAPAKETTEITEQPAVTASSSPLEGNSDNAQNEADVPAEETTEITEQPAVTASSSPLPYIIGGTAGGLALIAVVLSAILLQKLSKVTVNLEQKKSEIDFSQQKIQKLENQFSELQARQNAFQDTIQALQENDEKLMEQINNIRFEPIQSDDESEQLDSVMRKLREHKELLEYHNKLFHEMQSAQQTVQQNTIQLSQQLSALSSDFNSIQNTSTPTASKSGFSEDFSLSEPAPAGEIWLSYDQMLDLIDNQYNQAVFLSVSSDMAGQIDFYEDTERKAHIVVIGEKCYPNPYRFMNLDKNQETYSHLSVLAPIFELKNIVNGNMKYGMEEMFPAYVEQQEDNSFIIRKKGVIIFC